MISMADCFLRTVVLGGGEKSRKNCNRQDSLSGWQFESFLGGGGCGGGSGGFLFLYGKNGKVGLN